MLLLEKVTQSDQLVFVQLHLLIHLVEFGVLDVLLDVLKLLIFLDKLIFLLLNLLFEGHNKECLSLVPLSRLHNRCQITTCSSVFLGVLDELILLQEIFDRTLFPTHLVF